MKIKSHLVYSTIVALGIYMITRSLITSFMTFLSGIFIDLDHFIDYFYNERKIKIDIKDFFYKCENFKLEKAFIIFHSYEVMLIILFSNFWIRNDIYLGVTVGFISHFLIDVTYNFLNKCLYGNFKLLNYFFIYRWIVGFDFKKIFKTT